MTETTLIYGCGGHSRSVVDIILANNPDAVVCFVDDNARVNEALYGFPVVNKWYGNIIDCFIAIGDNNLRKGKYEEIGTERLINVISKTAHMGKQSQIGKGVYIGNFCHIGPEAIIGNNSIINNGAVVEHEVRIGDHCHIGPNATISGRCKIGELVFVGVGATIKDYVNICSSVVIGAGATVVKDIVEPGIYIGTPAKRFK